MCKKFKTKAMNKHKKGTIIFKKGTKITISNAKGLSDNTNNQIKNGIQDFNIRFEKFILNPLKKTE